MAKKKLLKPPAFNGQVFLCPNLQDILAFANKFPVATGHQPGFFHPGIVAKIFFLISLPNCSKEVIFIDIDRAKIFFPLLGNKIIFWDSLKPYYLTPAWGKKERFDFLAKVKKNLEPRFFSRVDYFGEIFLSISAQNLAELLVKTFIQYYNLNFNFKYLSSFLINDSFYELSQKILSNHNQFRNIFNQLLEDYKNTYRFRWRNYPFAPLKNKELPFWVLGDNNERKPCFISDIKEKYFSRGRILPRAVIISLFFRGWLNKFFIHGIGGGNYDWIAEKLAEKFWAKKLAPKAVVSASLFLAGTNNREAPYFLFDTNQLKTIVENLLIKNPKN